jgi:hypothetical protein
VNCGNRRRLSNSRQHADHPQRQARRPRSATTSSVSIQEAQQPSSSARERNITPFSDCGLPVNQPPLLLRLRRRRGARASLRGRPGPPQDRVRRPALRSLWRTSWRAGVQDVMRSHPNCNPPKGTVLLLIWSAGHFSDLRVHSYERSYDGIWATGGGFDGTGAATPVERRSEAGDSCGIGTRGIIWGCGCAAVRDLDGSLVHLAPTGSRVAGALSTKGTWLHAGVGRAGG